MLCRNTFIFIMIIGGILMEFLKNNRHFDFLYDETPFSKLECKIIQTEGENELTTV